VRFPEHRQCEKFARLLLEAGADPNDGQALYNCMFTPSSLCLELMIEFGLKPDHRCNWLLEGDGGGFVPHPEQTLRFQLNYAIKSGYVQRARLCIQNGADLSNRKGEGEVSVYEAAMLSGEPELAAFLVAHGAVETPLSSVSQFAAACMAADRGKATALLAKEPDLMQRTCIAQPKLLILAAEMKRSDSLRMMAELGADFQVPGPLFTAVWHGHLEIVKLLVELGADPTVRDSAHHATPMQWAHPSW
jgi:ankyrin repeat protein